MKKIVSILVICLCVVGCSKKEYERDSSAGERRFILLEQMEEKIENQDDFVLLFAQSTCMSCGEVNEILKEYLLTHNVTVYEVILDFEETTEVENKQVIDSYFTDFSTTPVFYYLKDGKQTDQLTPDASFDESVFDQWVVEYKMDEKK